MCGSKLESSAERPRPVVFHSSRQARAVGGGCGRGGGGSGGVIYVFSCFNTWL